MVQFMLATARDFGIAVRLRRQRLGLTQANLALAANVGRRFVIDLEDGKAACHLEKALAVASAVGMRWNDDVDAGVASGGSPGYEDFPVLGGGS